MARGSGQPLTWILAEGYQDEDDMKDDFQTVGTVQTCVFPLPQRDEPIGLVCLKTSKSVHAVRNELTRRKIEAHMLDEPFEEIEVKVKPELVKRLTANGLNRLGKQCGLPAQVASDSNPYVVKGHYLQVEAFQLGIRQELRRGGGSDSGASSRQPTPHHRDSSRRLSGNSSTDSNEPRNRNSYPEGATNLRKSSHSMNTASDSDPKKSKKPQHPPKQTVKSQAPPSPHPRTDKTRVQGDIDDIKRRRHPQGGASPKSSTPAPSGSGTSSHPSYAQIAGESNPGTPPRRGQPRPGSAVRVSSPDSLVFRAKTDDITLEVSKGEILGLNTVAAIVCSVKSNFNHLGGIAKGLKEKGGTKYKTKVDEAKKKHPSLRSSDCLTVHVKGISQLPFEKVLLINGPSEGQREEAQKKRLSESVKNALKTASEGKIHSLAIPLIGAGASGMPADVAARAILSTIKKDPPKPCNVRKVVFIDRGDNVQTMMRVARDIYK